MCFFFFSSQEWAHDWGWPTGLNEKPVSHTWVGILFRFIFISFAAGLFKKKVFAPVSKGSNSEEWANRERKVNKKQQNES